MFEYDESIRVDGDEDDDDDDDYHQIVGGERKRAGVSPIRRPEYLHQRPSRSFVRNRQSHSSESLDMSGEEGSPAPQGREESGPPPSRKMSVKDFTTQQSVEKDEKKPENLISMAGSFAKKLIGSDKKKDKQPSDAAAEPPPKPKPSGGPSSGPAQQQPPTEAKRPPQNNPQPKPQPKQRSAQEQKSKSEDDDDDDDEEDDYDDMNMAQIEGLLKQVQHPPPPTTAFSRQRHHLPHPPPGSPPSYAQRKPSYYNHLMHQIPATASPAIQQQRYDRGAAGEPYSARTQSSYLQPPPPPSTSTGSGVSQFYPGFGPATASLMRSQNSEDDLTDTEISVTETDMDFSKMEHLVEMYGPNGHALMDPTLMMAMPAPTLANFSVLDDEIMENVVSHRRMWEYSIDLKREKLRKRTLVMSDFLGVHAPGYAVYNPQDYEHLNVSPEIKELFHYITRYEPPIPGTQMDVKLKPFIPEYYPSVGDIDAFIKMVHPEVQDEGLGIKYLDEPSPFQSDPSVLDLRLRALAKQSSSKSVTVKKIDNVGKNAKIIENWIKDISDLHRSKPSPSVHYSKPMPDIDSLIQEWPPQVEDLLKNLSLPSSDLDCDLSTFIDIVCNLLDIPVYKSRIQSLHVLFTMYATYKHFNHYGALGGLGGGEVENGLGGGNAMEEGEIDRLQIN